MITISLGLRLLCISSTELLVEEAYYWNYAQHLDFGYLDHPPMVAILIHLSTLIFGLSELAVRIPSLCCWFFAAFFSYQLTNCISPGAGRYAVMLLAILPFFFLQSLVITPDQPLIVCWAASLYCLFRALVFDESRYWYIAGLCLGLGLLSKYTIVLLGLATLLYMLLVPDSRFWLKRKEPYLCALIALFVFTPVIYWNATHEWASFLFQSSRRFKAHYSFSFHEYLGLILFFLMPIGVVNLYSLLIARPTATVGGLSKRTLIFLQCYTIMPLLFFGFFSLTHPIKFNWIGPSLLAFIPWIALNLNIKTDEKVAQDVFRVMEGCRIKHWLPQSSHDTGMSMNRFLWFFTAVGLLWAYGCFIIMLLLGRPEIINQTLFKKFISWGTLTAQFHSIAQKIEQSTHQSPIFSPLDTYNINSELSYYQSRLHLKPIYPIQGQHVFGGDSLMYRYWLPNHIASNQVLILISPKREDFNRSEFANHLTYLSPIQLIWAHSQSKHGNLAPYYYQVVRSNDVIGKTS